MIRSMAISLVALVVATACAQPASRIAAPPSGQGQQPAARPSQTLTTAVRYEPVSLAAKPLRATGSTADYTVRLFNAELVQRDARDTARAYLAEGLPQLNTDSWRVFPDGRMETTYRLKPKLTWHDGTPLTAADFVFGWRVYSTPELGLANSRPQNLMEEVVDPDPGIVVIRWRGPYPDAGALATPLFQALPRHILGATLSSGDADAFVNHPYWAIQYIGAGPYRLERWEPGALIEASAFDGHVLGRPKIDRLIVRFFTDENTALTNLLSENVQLAMDRALRYEHTGTLKERWPSPDKGVVILTPTQWRYMWVQTRPAVVEPRALLDKRVRQALAHTTDKEGLNDLFGGEGAMADTLLPRNVPYFAELDRAITKYPYNPRRADQLMGEVGFTKAGDGVYAGNGERMSFEFWGDSGSQFEKDLAVVGAGWNRVGFDTRLSVLAAAQFRDIEYRTTFKGVYSTTSGAAAANRLDNFTSSSIPTPENRWSGSNYAAWSNPEFDRLWVEISTTLDQNQRNRQAVEMMRIVSEDVVIMPLFHNFEVAAHYATLSGPDRNPVFFGLMSWNVHEWELH
jgi:peptide/nickel transport system substrate-binding protein